MLREPNLVYKIDVLMFFRSDLTQLSPSGLAAVTGDSALVICDIQRKFQDVPSVSSSSSLLT